MSTTVTPIVPTTGVASLNAISLAFPGIGNSLSNYLGIHPSLPGSGQIQMSQFRGITAPTPTFSNLLTLNSTGTNMSFNNMNFGGYVASGQLGSQSINFVNYLDNAAYHKNMNYTYTGTAPNNTTLSSIGALLINNTPQSITSAISVKAINQYGNYVTMIINFNLLQPTAPAPLSTANTPTFGTYNGSKYPVTWSFNLSNITSSTTPTSTNITSISWNSATKTLTGLIAASTTPNCTLSLTNAVSGYDTILLYPAFTGTATSPVLLLAPVASGTVPAKTALTNVATTINMSSYFTGTIASYAITTNPYAATFSGSTLTITPAYRGITYTVAFTATNAGGTSAPQSVSVTELGTYGIPTGTWQSGNLTIVFSGNTVSGTNTGTAWFTSYAVVDTGNNVWSFNGGGNTNFYGSFTVSSVQQTGSTAIWGNGVWTFTKLGAPAPLSTANTPTF